MICTLFFLGKNSLFEDIQREIFQLFGLFLLHLLCVENTYCKYTVLFLQIGVFFFTSFSFSLFLAHRVKYLGRRHRTWLKFLEQVLYPNLWTEETWMLNLGHAFQMLEEVIKVFGTDALR